MAKLYVVQWQDVGFPSFESDKNEYGGTEICRTYNPEVVDTLLQDVFEDDNKFVVEGTDLFDTFDSLKELRGYMLSQEMEDYVGDQGQKYISFGKACAYKVNQFTACDCGAWYECGLGWMGRCDCK